MDVLLNLYDISDGEIEMITELLDSGIISESSSEYASPMVLVKRLNRFTAKEVFTTPNIEERLHEVMKHLKAVGIPPLLRPMVCVNSNVCLLAIPAFDGPY